MRLRQLSLVSKSLFLCALILGTSLAPISTVSAATRNNCSGTSLPVLRQGDKGSCVLLAQQLLASKGALTATPNGNFGPATKAATIQLQSQAGITQDGIIGRNTWRALGSSGQTASNAATSVSSLPAKCQTNAKTICIVKGNRSEAILYAVQNKSIVMTLKVRTGDARGSNYATTEGAYSVGRRYVTYTSKAYDTPMPYSLFFNGGQAIHYSDTFRQQGYGNGSSHGCVNISNKSDAKRLYEWSPLYTRVIVTR